MISVRLFALSRISRPPGKNRVDDETRIQSPHYAGYPLARYLHSLEALQLIILGPFKFYSIERGGGGKIQSRTALESTVNVLTSFEIPASSPYYCSLNVEHLELLIPLSHLVADMAITTNHLQPSSRALLVEKESLWDFSWPH